MERLEPEKSGEVESEAGDEERGDQTEEGVEEWNGLCNDPANNGDDGDERNPDDPSLLAVDILDRGVLEDTVHDIAPNDCAVDASRDENDWQSDSEGDSRDGEAGTEQSWRLHRLSDKGVDQGTSQGVDEDLDQAQSPDGLDIILWRVHFRHEGELADGEGVCENDVGGG
ncbi:hypothetical protein AC579_6798 [Pseudocercospora musae]|uniref:Uncharacterized protein n=1 Tax=Pseudocercospora musae TaxID=113226 RepID=A0A139IPZ0_9PEZI|nr:hypothetical protein AC579_6798 [Pseudocercospora musae]